MKKDLKKFVKLDIRYIISGILFFIAFIFGVVLAYYNIGRTHIKLDNIRKSGYSSKVEVAYYPYRINISGKDNDYYFTMDKDKYLHIVYMSNKKYEEIKESISKAEKVTIIGISKNYDETLKEEITEIYNNIVQKEVINEDNVYRYIGKFYLDAVTTAKPKYQEKVPAWYIIALDIMLLSGAIGSINVAIKNYYKSKKTYQELSDNKIKTINKEMNEKDILEYKASRIILTNNYIIDHNKYLVVKKYNEIKWMYKNELRDYIFFISKRTIIAYDKEGNKYELATGLRSKNKRKFSQIYNYIKAKNPKVIEENTEESLEKYLKLIEK